MYAHTEGRLVMSQDIKKQITETVLALENNYKTQDMFELGVGEKLPNSSEVIEIIREIRRIMYPGYFGKENIAYVSLDNFAGTTLASVYEKLYRQIRVALTYKAENKEFDDSRELAEKLALEFIERLPYVQEMLYKDVEAELEGDPAANSKEEVIISYPGIFAIFVYRIAHELYKMNIPFIPRIMTEYAHGKTGIDINPGAEIGEYFFIDHGTGIVIGETCEIGNHVKIYQGVTLGALSLRKGQALSGTKRHPTIEDNVVIYANATILGGNTVIGKNSVVAGNTFVIESIPADTTVSAYMPELKYKNRKQG